MRRFSGNKMNKTTKTKSVIHGDALKLFLESNNRTLEIIGDGCRLKINENSGKIRMIGDGSRLEIITRNSGEIEYRGDGGRIVLGPEVSTKGILYVGDGGRVGRPSAAEPTGIIEKSHGIGICKTSRLTMKNVYTPD